MLDYPPRRHLIVPKPKKRKRLLPLPPPISKPNNIKEQPPLSPWIPHCSTTHVSQRQQQSATRTQIKIDYKLEKKCCHLLPNSQPTLTKTQITVRRWKAVRNTCHRTKHGKQKKIQSNATLNPKSQFFFQSYESNLPTSLTYMILSTRGCAPWRPAAVMGTDEWETDHLEKAPLDFHGSSKLHQTTQKVSCFAGHLSRSPVNLIPGSSFEKNQTALRTATCDRSNKTSPFLRGGVSLAQASKSFDCTHNRIFFDR